MTSTFMFTENIILESILQRPLCKGERTYSGSSFQVAIIAQTEMIALYALLVAVVLILCFIKELLPRMFLCDNISASELLTNDFDELSKNYRG